MSNPYKPPSSSVGVEKGIDGKTCPVCENHFNFVSMVFVIGAPNTYTCSKCKTKLRHNFPPKIGFFLFSLFGIICISVLYYLDVGLGLGAGERRNVYFWVALVPGILCGIAVLVYARERMLLVVK